MLVSEAILTTRLRENMEFEHKYHMLERAMRTLMNMVPDPRNDDKWSELSTTLFGASNYYQPLECLGGHCAIEFMLGNNTVVENSHWRSP